MKLSEFPLLTDENIDPEVVAGLRGLGFDVVDVVESGRQGATDVDLLRWASVHRRVVVSHDADFGTLAILQNEPLEGLVYLRPGHIDSQFSMETFRALLNADIDLTPPFMLVAKRSGNQVTIRVRNLGDGGR